ncbi:MAG: hypothetical protein HOO06_10730 [Bdellovibrionaceae bacterium]|jgi:hypothetical protein|nr:hypothetical protein [Pseudobdellovibrionaceae bacterium]
MKKIIFITILSIFASLSTYANTWQRFEANVSVNSNYVEAEVSNIWGRPLLCRGDAFAQTSRGFWRSQAMPITVVPAGLTAFVQLMNTTPQTDPIVNGYANIECKFQF